MKSRRLKWQFKRCKQQSPFKIAIIWALIGPLFCSSFVSALQYWRTEIHCCCRN